MHHCVAFAPNKIKVENGCTIDKCCIYGGVIKWGVIIKGLMICQYCNKVILFKLIESNCASKTDFGCEIIVNLGWGSKPLFLAVQKRLEFSRSAVQQYAIFSIYLDLVTHVLSVEKRNGKAS